MEATDTHKWTVKQERRLLEQEERFNMKTATNLGISKWDDHSESTRPDLQVSFDQFRQKKDTEKLRKVKGSTPFDEIAFFNIATQQEATTCILSRFSAIESKLFHLHGASSFPPMSKKMVRATTMAFSQASKELQVILREFKFPHKHFWRILLSMRHIDYSQFISCHLHDIKAIDGAVVDSFDTNQASLELLKFFNEEGTQDKKGVLLLLDTLVALQRMGPKPRNPLRLYVNQIEASKKELMDYVESEGISNAIKI